MKHAYMKKLRNASTQEELKDIANDIYYEYLKDCMSEETFDILWDLFHHLKAKIAKLP